MPTRFAGRRAAAGLSTFVAAIVISIGSATAQSGVPYAYPYPLPPPPNATGDWTFGESASPTVSVDYQAIDPKSGRIANVQVGGSTNYARLNAKVATGDAVNTVGRIATATDTLSVTSSIGLATSRSTDVYFSCLSPPCVAFTNFVNTPTSIVNGTSFATFTPVYSGNATSFVQDNAKYYGAASVTLSSSTSISNQLGSVSGYSINGQYTAQLGRPVIPWTTGDIVHDTLKVPAVQIGAMVLNPKPQLGFTAMEAAHLSQYDNFNYVQTYTGAGTIVLPSVGFSGWVPSSFDPGGIVTNPGGTIYAGQPASDPRAIGSFDPLPGGNPGSVGGTRYADAFAPYWDQVPYTGTLGPGDTVQELFSLHENGLNFGDMPDLGVAGRFLSFKTSLVGVVQGDEANYQVLSDVFGDPSLTFNWLWVQTGPGAGTAVRTAGDSTADAPLGIAFLLGYGDLSDADLRRLIYADITSVPSYLSGVTPGVPEPATWAMMLIGFAGLGVAGYRKRASASV